MPDTDDFNTNITAEFRANAGKVGGMFEGAPLLLLHTTGAKSGQPRLHPLMYQPIGKNFAIFASYAGAPKHPAWYHNLVAHPDASVEVGTDTVTVKACVTTDDERATIWTKQKELYPNFADYEQLTDREIPVVILERP